VGWSLFVHTVVDVARDGRRHRRGRAYVGGRGRRRQALRDDCQARPTPEEMAVHRERLAIVATCVAGRVARLRSSDLSRRSPRRTDPDGVANN
jgi:hypothetical protein